MIDNQEKEIHDLILQCKPMAPVKKIVLRSRSGEPRKINTLKSNFSIAASESTTNHNSLLKPPSSNSAKKYLLDEPKIVKVITTPQVYSNRNSIKKEKSSELLPPRPTS